ncbi:hypothetical protein TNCV_472121 [Trichonephila clavipes]|nr:hypothetical protein TNCV_472121 [Trichonephila clavipes]
MGNSNRKEEKWRMEKEGYPNGVMRNGEIQIRKWRNGDRRNGETERVESKNGERRNEDTQMERSNGGTLNDCKTKGVFYSYCHRPMHYFI